MNKFVSLFFAFVLNAACAVAQTGNFIPSERFSSGLVASLCQDRYGSIWIATDYGLNRFDGYRFEVFLHSDDNPSSICNNVVVSMLCDRQGRLWVGTNRGLDRYDEALGGFVHYQFPENIQPRISEIVQLRSDSILLVTAGYGAYLVGGDSRLLPTDAYADSANNHYFTHIFEDSKGRVWKTGYDNTVVMRSNGKFQHIQSKGEPMGIVERDGEVLIIGLRGIVSYCEGKLCDDVIDMRVIAGRDVLFSSVGTDADGNIYIGTRGSGLFRILRGSHRLERYDVSVFGTNLNTAKVWSILSDRHGNLWLGLQRKGLVVIPQRPMLFSNWSFEAQDINLGSTISSVCEGDGGMTWSTVQGVGVYGFDAKGRVVAHPSAPAPVEFIFRDRHQRYWIGTDNGLYAYNPLTGASSLKVNFECDKFNDMTSDATGNIYISTFSRGFCVYNPQSGALQNYRNVGNDTVRIGHLCNDWVMCMMPDRNGCIWMGTASGVSCFNPKTGSFLTYGWNDLLSGVMCFSLCELSDGNIAIGTDRGLFLYDHATRKTTLFPASEQLRDKTVNYIVQSNDGDVWCSTSMGIWQYDASEQQFIGYVNGSGLSKHEYLYAVGLHTNDDRILFGNNDGLTVFNPATVSAAQAAGDEVMLTGFLVGRTFVNATTELNGVQITEKAVIESDHFTLSYLDHTFTLCFSQLNFENPMNVTFEYCINGGDWERGAEGQNEFTLSNLRPGKYKIKVRAMAGNVFSPEKLITVTVLAPWYRTTLAYILYFVAFVALLGLLGWVWRRRAAEHLNEEKMRFLINATHDIRSPLTLILAPLEKLKAIKTNGLKTPEELQRFNESVLQPSMGVIENNAQRILNLVNQILDVRKIDKQQMQLQCEQTDLVEFTSAVCRMFDYNARERSITFRFLHEGLERLDVWFDRSQFDKVITNLLSNAFKYTADGGAIDVVLTADENNASLQVIDNGVGIDSDSLRHIFDRFYQGGNSRRLHVSGTGIGLNLCKMIVDMHHGTITAANRSDGTGAVFTVSLLLGNAHLKPSEIDMESKEQFVSDAAETVNVVNESTDVNSGNDDNAGSQEENTVETPAAAVAVSTTTAPSSSSKHRVLLVDDDPEIGRYIATELGRYYKFTLCHNGKEGLRELLTNEYEAVVSDVMMPQMDGFTMLRMIKTNINISDVPVIMLTSMADVANRLQGLERGADAFLAKPFNMEELHKNIDNLIAGRQRLKGKYSGAQLQSDRVEVPEIKGNDELLMERIMKAVNKNLSNSDFNVDMLTQEVGISRAQLHRKMKEMTGISTSEFIRNIRLEQAARLLKEQKVNITQVAYSVGFSNLAHFSTIFRKHFGLSPSEYVEREAG